MLGLIIKGQNVLASKKADNETTLMSFKDEGANGTSTLRWDSVK